MHQYFVSCVVPAHNEEGNLSKLLEKLIPVLEVDPLISNYEVIIVNDNSTDLTGSIIDSYSNLNSFCFVPPLVDLGKGLMEPSPEAHKFIMRFAS